MCVPSPTKESGYLVKITDFGMSKVLTKSEYYKKSMSNNNNNEIPYRWAAPELIQENSKISQASDIWAFGVVLWEMYTGGHTPYGLKPAAEIETFILQGNRLAQPAGCPTAIYDLMKECWAGEAEKRPIFASLYTSLQLLFKMSQKDE